jgi:hypothetical protein
MQVVAPAECENPMTLDIDPGATWPECPMCTGKPAHCVPKSVVMSVAPDQIGQLTECDDMSVCVPDILTVTQGLYAPPTCSSISGGAGRCLSVCIGAVAALETFLPQDTCPDGEKCAPCSDPRTGMDTGACSLTCDVGPTEPAAVFGRCCEGDIGICVPPELVDDTQRAALAQASCEAGTLCAPEVFADTTFVPATCRSVGDAEGRCLSTCVSLVSEQAELLPKDTCGDGELCAPCTDPRTGDPTGACTLNGDMPTEEPVIFDKECCGATGLCVPSSAVPERYLSLLPPDTCETDAPSGWVCAPKLKLNDLSARLPECIVEFLLPGNPLAPNDPNRIGACIPQCIADKVLLDNPAAGFALFKSNCPEGQLCAPCINPVGTPDPVTGMPPRTGACD